jgi:hypothetical protein
VLGHAIDVVQVRSDIERFSIGSLMVDYQFVLVHRIVFWIKSGKGWEIWKSDSSRMKVGVRSNFVVQELLEIVIEISVCLSSIGKFGRTTVAGRRELASDDRGVSHSPGIIGGIDMKQCSS